MSNDGSGQNPTTTLDARTYLARAIDDRLAGRDFAADRNMFMATTCPTFTRSVFGEYLLELAVRLPRHGRILEADIALVHAVFVHEDTLSLRERVVLFEEACGRIDMWHDATPELAAA